MWDRDRDRYRYRSSWEKQLRGVYLAELQPEAQQITFSWQLTLAVYGAASVEEYLLELITLGMR
jgi:hypothetical protein